MLLVSQDVICFAEGPAHLLVAFRIKTKSLITVFSYREKKLENLKSERTDCKSESDSYWRVNLSKIPFFFLEPQRVSLYIRFENGYQKGCHEN